MADDSQKPITFECQDFKDCENRVKESEKEILEVFYKVFKLYKPCEIMMAFNGGKDCTVVLHMLHTFFQKNAYFKEIKIPTLYFTDPNGFEEVDHFVDKCKDLYNIELITKKGPIKEALTEICKENSKIKAIFMGCRRTDPYCKDLKVMQVCDPGWPPIMRINPVIDWKCRQVWEYIYHYNVPYCKLYERGYTSIGNKTNTKPNPYLRLVDDISGKLTEYRHANELLDRDELERAGRY